MKTFARISAVAVLLAGFAAAASAQSNDTVSVVPFEFSVGTSSMPRDTYRVTALAGRTGFMIQGERRTAIMLSQQTGRTTDDRPRLVFHRYGDHYFLHEIRMPDNTGFELPLSRDERTAAERIAGTSTPEVVVVHAR